MPARFPEKAITRFSSRRAQITEATLALADEYGRDRGHAPDQLPGLLQMTGVPVLAPVRGDCAAAVLPRDGAGNLRPGLSLNQPLDLAEAGEAGSCAQFGAIDLLPVPSLDIEVEVTRGLNRHVCHRHAGRGAVPVPGPGRVADDIASSDDVHTLLVAD